MATKVLFCSLRNGRQTKKQQALKISKILPFLDVALYLSLWRHLSHKHTHAQTCTCRTTLNRYTKIPLQDSAIIFSTPIGHPTWSQNWEQKKTNKQKTHKHFCDGPLGDNRPQGRTRTRPQGQTGQNGDFTVELNRERPVCPRDGSHFVPGRGPICPRDSSCLSRTPSRPKCLCLLAFSCPKNFSNAKAGTSTDSSALLFFVAVPESLN